MALLSSPDTGTLANCGSLWAHICRRGQIVLSSKCVVLPCDTAWATVQKICRRSNQSKLSHDCIKSIKIGGSQETEQKNVRPVFRRSNPNNATQIACGVWAIEVAYSVSLWITETLANHGHLWDHVFGRGQMALSSEPVALACDAALWKDSFDWLYVSLRKHISLHLHQLLGFIWSDWWVGIGRWPNWGGKKRKEKSYKFSISDTNYPDVCCTHLVRTSSTLLLHILLPAHAHGYKGPEV